MNMKEKRTCIKQTYNRHMGMECWSDEHTIFFIDKSGWIKVGDVVEVERDGKGFTERVWVNGELKTEQLNK